MLSTTYVDSKYFLYAVKPRFWIFCCVCGYVCLYLHNVWYQFFWHIFTYAAFYRTLSSGMVYANRAWGRMLIHWARQPCMQMLAHSVGCFVCDCHACMHRTASLASTWPVWTGTWRWWSILLSGEARRCWCWRTMWVRMLDVLWDGLFVFSAWGKTQPSLGLCVQSAGDVYNLCECYD